MKTQPILLPFALLPTDPQPSKTIRAALSVLMLSGAIGCGDELPPELSTRTQRRTIDPNCGEIGCPDRAVEARAVELSSEILLTVWINPPLDAPGTAIAEIPTDSVTFSIHGYKEVVLQGVADEVTLTLPGEFGGEPFDVFVEPL